MSEQLPDLPWHTMHGSTLLGMLQRCHDGEDPMLVYTEEYANAERIEPVPPPEDSV